MKSVGRWVALGGWCAWLATSYAAPALLLKNYSAQIIRGHYFLGKRLVRVGEIVTVRAVHDFDAQVATADGDAFVVALADLRALPENSPLVRHVAPPPASTPLPVSAPLPKPTPAPQARDAAVSPGPRREVAVQCTHLTRKGVQCTRMTHSPNGLCWQHGGD